MLNDIDNSVLDSLKSFTLLCVEDSKTTQLIYSSIFEDLVKNIIFANSGEDGYRKFCNEDIDLIITDYDMPVLNGIDMIKKIREKDRDIPILLVSAITDIDVMVNALQLNVNNFIKKPIQISEVIQATKNIAKLSIANKYLEEQRQKKIKDLEKKEKYSSYQEDLAFSKELNILRNDFYYQMIDSGFEALVDFFYKPLDVLSGDAYSARKIDSTIAFYFIVDGMGKGLSASLSSMLITTYVNHIVDKMGNSFNLNKLIEESIAYIKPILLEDEALAVDFIVIDYKTSTMQYAKFAMPASLAQSTENKIISIKSNNPPLSKYTKDFTISDMDISKITKFLFFSDGIVENSVRYDDKLYASFIEEDFLSSFTKDELREKILWKTDTQEDDMTFIFINQLALYEHSGHIEKTFQCNLDAVDEANDWYCDFWNNITNNHKLAYNAGVVFSELFMNAYEHGNLGIDANSKHKLLSEDRYFTTLEEMQKDCDKEIEVTIYTVEYSSTKYLITIIKDEGRGFDTQILSEIFRNRKNFNGRGVYISRQSSLGIYYNAAGTTVLFLHRLEDEV